MRSLTGMFFALLLVGCAATVDRSAQQAQLSSFLARCDRLDQAGTFPSTEAAMACWLTPTREMIVRDGSPPLPLFDAYSAEVITLANLYDRGYLNEAGFHDHYRDATLRFSHAWSAQVQRSSETNTGSPGIGTLAVIGALGLLNSNPPPHPQPILLPPPPAPAATPHIDMRPR